MTSLRARLLLWLFAALALIGIVASVAIYMRAQRDIDALLDYQLQQVAFSLARHGPPTEPLSPFQREPDFVTQIWDRNGALVFYSRPNFALPLRVQAGFANMDWKGEAWRVYTESDGAHIVQVAHPLRLRQDMAAGLARRAVIPLLALLPVVALVIWFGVGQALGPLEALSRDLRSRSAANLGPVGARDLPDEVQPLVASLNDLFARLDRALQLQREFLSDAAHELRTPLAAVQLQLQVLQRANSEEEKQDALARLEQGVRRSSRLVQQLLTLARQEPEGLTEPPRKVDLQVLVRSTVNDFLPLARAKGLRLEADGTPAEIRGDPDALRVMISNLLDNAIRYTPSGGRVQVSTHGDLPWVTLKVADSGLGVPVAERVRVFDRFYRPPGSDSEGSGLGLAIVQQVAQRHGGRVELADGLDGHGLAVLVDLPASGLQA